MRIFLVSQTYSRPQFAHVQTNTHKAKPFPRNSLFDAECKNKKKEVKLLAKHMQKHPDCTVTLNNYWKAKREYKTLTRQKKHRAIAEQHAKLAA